MKRHCLLCVLLLTGCGGETQPPVPKGPPYASPQACLDAGAAALAANDAEGLFVCLSPRGQDIAAGFAQIMMLGIARRSPDLAVEILDYINANGMPMNDDLKSAGISSTPWSRAMRWP